MLLCKDTSRSLERTSYQMRQNVFEVKIDAKGCQWGMLDMNLVLMNSLQ